jgi:hypothetical protein
VLRLNCETLVERRLQARDAYLRAHGLAQYKGTLKRETLRRWIDEIDNTPAGHALPSFASFLRSWLERKCR